MISRVRTSPEEWDVIIIGGGATGLGTAVDATLRGYKTVLFEQHDFAKGTSSRSTKMAHGGVRYLQQGNIPLVREALHERGRMIRNAPHLASRVAFIVPRYEWWEMPYYGAGLKLYDVLAGRLGLGGSRFLSVRATQSLLPNVETRGLRGGILFWDGQFDDARLAINLARTAADNGGALMNYTRVTGLVKSQGRIRGVTARDEETGHEFEIRAKVVVNATGPFSDSVIRMDDPAAERIISPSQGVHLVIDREFLPGENALMVPKTSDGRVLFAVPWHKKLIVGTTDTKVEKPVLEPRPLEKEVDFILANLARYLSRDASRKDVMSAYAGIRPLVAPSSTSNTAAVSRDETILVSDSGLVTIAGGKWTTYRNMGEKTVTKAALVGGLKTRPCATREAQIHGYHTNSSEFGELWYYGSDAPSVQALVREDPELGKPIHPQIPDVIGAQVAFAVREEMARSVEDFLARRTRTLLLDARRSIEAAPKVAQIMARELKKDSSWCAQQVSAYSEQARGYIVS